MKKIQLFNVGPSVPEELHFLETLSRNLWWCWNLDAIELFRRIDPQLWREKGHNPPVFLSHIPQERFQALAEDASFLSHYEQVMQRFEAEVQHGHDGRAACVPAGCVGYFSMEYGIHESIGLYSGGLGCLAGDYLKSASDLNMPVVAVGLLYRCGFFSQYLNQDGWQQEARQENPLNELPLQKACDSSGRQIEVAVPLPDGSMRALVWRLDVGRVPLYLLDTGLPENPPEVRAVTMQLYEADRTVRLRQELLLGFGGFQALAALGHEPVACHINEGHAAFVSLARLGHLIRRGGHDPESAMEVVTRSNVFTTHTPVPAGHETFPLDLLKPHLVALEEEIGLSAAEVIVLGQARGWGNPDEFTMTLLAIRTSGHRNAVSRLHGKVSRAMWSHVWPECPVDEVPIAHVTNGVHVSSWLSPDNTILFDRYLGPEWRDTPGNREIVSRVSQIPDEELWRAHELGRSRLIRVVRDLVERSLIMRQAPRSEVVEARSILHHDCLTIGFARRFATYKRANLVLKDPARLESILANKDRPVQIVFAGKAHPADHGGKDLIRQIVQFAHRAGVRRRVLFLENYDIRLARYLIQGVDVWLNTPRRPQEACGTSGMKAALNGAINVSILDGWWDEVYASDRGWAIGGRDSFQNSEYQDAVEAQALYNLLEGEVIPAFYERPEGDIPSKWVKMMKESMRTVLSMFTSHRMASEYESLLYKPALAAFGELTGENARRAKELVTQRKRLEQLWPDVRIGVPAIEGDLSNLHVGDRFRVSVVAELGQLAPEEVLVAVFYGPVDADNTIVRSETVAMDHAEALGSGKHLFRAEITCGVTGRYGLTARAMPRGPEWRGCIPGFITWAEGD